MCQEMKTAMPEIGSTVYNSEYATAIGKAEPEGKPKTDPMRKRKEQAATGPEDRQQKDKKKKKTGSQVIPAGLGASNGDDQPEHDIDDDDVDDDDGDDVWDPLADE